MFSMLKVKKVLQDNNDRDQASDDSVSLVEQIVDASKVKDGQQTAKATFDFEDLTIAVRDFLLAGDGTSSITLRIALMLLANHPETQARMQKEIDVVVGKDRLPSLNDEPNLPFTQAFILETMRRYTLVPLAVPHMTTCDTQLGNLFIPANTMVRSFI